MFKKFKHLFKVTILSLKLISKSIIEDCIQKEFISCKYIETSIVEYLKLNCNPWDTISIMAWSEVIKYFFYNEKNCCGNRKLYQLTLKIFKGICTYKSVCTIWSVWLVWVIGHILVRKKLCDVKMTRKKYEAQIDDAGTV